MATRWLLAALLLVACATTPGGGVAPRRATQEDVVRDVSRAVAVELDATFRVVAADFGTTFRAVRGVLEERWFMLLAEDKRSGRIVTAFRVFTLVETEDNSRALAGEEIVITRIEMKEDNNRLIPPERRNQHPLGPYPDTRRMRTRIEATLTSVSGDSTRVRLDFFMEEPKSDSWISRRPSPSEIQVASATLFELIEKYAHAGKDEPQSFKYLLKGVPKTP